MRGRVKTRQVMGGVDTMQRAREVRVKDTASDGDELRLLWGVQEIR